MQQIFTYDSALYLSKNLKDVRRKLKKCKIVLWWNTDRNCSMAAQIFHLLLQVSTKQPIAFGNKFKDFPKVSQIPAWFVYRNKFKELSEIKFYGRIYWARFTHERPQLWNAKHDSQKWPKQIFLLAPKAVLACDSQSHKALLIFPLKRRRKYLWVENGWKR